MNKRLGIVNDEQRHKNELLPTIENFEEKIEENDDDQNIKSQAVGQNSRRAFLRELRKIVESAEVILHVLDARDPIGTKSTAIEEMVLSQPGKKLVYVVNKADLVPRDVLIGWLTYLRQYHPAIPFKCNTQNQKGNLGRTSGKVSQLEQSALLSNQTIGAEELLNLLKNYCRLDGTQSKSSISVGIVGFPNVGKSSLINSLTRTRAVNVSSVPGKTKLVQEVILDKNIRLLDSPGVVFADSDTGSTILRNCVNVDEMLDVISPIESILQRCPSNYLMQIYSIPRFQQNDTLGFLSLIARSQGKLKRGGIPNIEAAAKGILHDWNAGKIKYYCKPPTLSKNNISSEAIRREEESGDTKILSTFGNQINFDNLTDSDIRVLDALSVLDSTSYVPVEHLEYIGGDRQSNNNNDDMEQENDNDDNDNNDDNNNDDEEEDNYYNGNNDDDDNDNEDDHQTSTKSNRTRTTSISSSASTSTSTNRQKKEKKSKSSSNNKSKNNSNDMELGNSVSLRSQQKKLAKKAAKETRRSQSVVDTSTLQDYNFETDFQY